jgi:Anti-sigma-K factor rskA
VTGSDDDRIAYLAGEPVDSLSPQERAELDELIGALDAPAMWAQPGDGLEDRIVNAIAQEAERRSAAGPTPAPTPTPAPAPAPAPRVRRPMFSRRRIYALGAVAVAAVAAIVVVISLRTTSPAQLRLAMVVSGTSLAPGAHGSATLTKTASGWRIQLSATGLRHLSGARYYQAWLKDSAGTLVPVGTFNDARQVTLWSGVPATQFRTLTVTVQQANGDPRSSGQRVLTGTAGPVG